MYVKDVNDTVLKNREYKFLPHLFLSQYDASVYVDSNIKIIQDPVTLIEKYIEILSCFGSQTFFKKLYL
ncbi:hypothetical protein WIA82_08965 [Klebsiella pneumoniae]